MEMDLFIALLSCAVSFFIFLKVIDYLNHIFSVEIPDFIGFVLGLIVIAGLYIKKDFFFGGNPIITGITIGVFLALLWNIRYTGFMNAILKTIISLRFVVWVVSTGAGIYKKDIIMDIWNKYIIPNAGQLKPYILAAVVILYIIGTVFILFPEAQVKRRMKSEGLSFNNKVSTSRKIFTQIIGILFILISSYLMTEAIFYFYSLFK